MTAAPKQQSTSPLLKLPAELRDAIYTLALVDDEPIYISLPEPARPLSLREPALLAVNRQIRNETLPIYYGTNIFEPRSSVTTENFLRLLGSGRIALLKSLRAFARIGHCSRDGATAAAEIAWWKKWLLQRVTQWQQTFGEVLEAEAVHVPLLVGRDEWLWVPSSELREWVGEARDGRILWRKGEIGGV